MHFSFFFAFLCSKKSSWTGIWAVWGFQFRKMTLHGHPATVVPFEKRSVFRVCFNINRILFACYNCVAHHFGTYGVFGTEKTPSICIFPSFSLFCVLRNRPGRAYGQFGVFNFEK